MKTPRSTLCPVCGEGELRYFARAGRTYDYKGFMYPIPAGLKLVECTRCHEMPMTPDEVEAIEAPIAERHRARMADALDDSLLKLQERVTIGELERILHLSQGYLARARSKTEPSFALVALVKLLAEDPKKLAVVARIAGAS